MNKEDILRAIRILFLGFIIVTSPAIANSEEENDLKSGAPVSGWAELNRSANQAKGVYPGLYVREIPGVNGAPAGYYPFRDDMEDPSSGNWAADVPWGLTTIDAHSPIRS